jgi:hypothetical protein
VEVGKRAAETIGYPWCCGPLHAGGHGGGFADDETELMPRLKNALSFPP